MYDIIHIYRWYWFRISYYVLNYINYIYILNALRDFY